jgi:hypothetical protein
MIAIAASIAMQQDAATLLQQLQPHCTQNKALIAEVAVHIGARRLSHRLLT